MGLPVITDFWRFQSVSGLPPPAPTCHLQTPTFSIPNSFCAGFRQKCPQFTHIFHPPCVPPPPVPTPSAKCIKQQWSEANPIELSATYLPRRLGMALPGKISIEAFLPWSSCQPARSVINTQAGRRKKRVQSGFDIRAGVVGRTQGLGGTHFWLVRNTNPKKNVPKNRDKMQFWARLGQNFEKNAQIFLNKSVRRKSFIAGGIDIGCLWREKKLRKNCRKNCGNCGKTTEKLLPGCTLFCWRGLEIISHSRKLGKGLKKGPEICKILFQFCKI